MKNAKKEIKKKGDYNQQKERIKNTFKDEIIFEK